MWLLCLILIDSLKIIRRAHVSWHYLHFKFIKIKWVILNLCHTQVTLKHLMGNSWASCLQGATSRWLASHQIACVCLSMCYGGGGARVKLMRKTAVFLVVLTKNQVSQFRVPLQPHWQDILVDHQWKQWGRKRKLQDITNIASCCLYNRNGEGGYSEKVNW